MELQDDPTSINHEIRLLEDTEDGDMGHDDLFGSTASNVDSNDLNSSLNVATSKRESGTGVGWSRRGRGVAGAGLCAAWLEQAVRAAWLERRARGVAGHWRLDKRQLEACRVRAGAGVGWRRAACASAPALAGGVRVGAGWRRARRRWLATCASAWALSGGVRLCASAVLCPNPGGASAVLCPNPGGCAHQNKL
ncbi:hypothetical protein GUJ93_ZPchr0013g37357 [Zizania palustris]|uniref:Uncharacterized protein n=1 Tax=Zizania palustris TaxID=103762 RepID=A0A8J5WXL8_ZIZPA|nr:hypothetical protein GUJ93_ZPchr0013g37357 [Zizania palustris]